MAPYQRPPYDPALSHDLPNLDCHTTCIPHYPGGVSGWPSSLHERNTSTSSNACLSAHLDGSRWWSRLRGTAVKVPGPNSVVVLAKCKFWAGATSEPGRGKPGHAVRWNPFETGSVHRHSMPDRLGKTGTLWLVPVRCTLDYSTLGSSVPLACTMSTRCSGGCSAPPGMTITSADSYKQTWAVPGGVRDPACGDGLLGPKRDNGPATKAIVSFHSGSNSSGASRKKEAPASDGSSPAVQQSSRRAEHRIEVPLRAPSLGQSERPCPAAVDNAVARARHCSMSRTKTQ